MVSERGPGRSDGTAGWGRPRMSAPATAPGRGGGGLAQDEPLDLSIVMPCLNEAGGLEYCIESAQASLARLGVRGEVVIADNGSHDGSQSIARRMGARVIDVPDRGYGRALMGGISAARGEFVIMGDADGSYDFSRLEPFLAQLRSGHDIVLGNRFDGGIAEGAMPLLHRRLGNPLLTRIAHRVSGSAAGDVYCGLRGFRKGVVEALNLRCSGMEFALEMVVKAALSGLSVTEVPTTLSPDRRDRPSHLRTWRDGCRSMRVLGRFSPHLFLGSRHTGRRNRDPISPPTMPSAAWPMSEIALVGPTAPPALGLHGRERVWPASRGRLELGGLALLGLVALGLWLAFPVLPTSDSAWAVVWGHQILGGHLPSFAEYRAPTEHPLWLALGTLSAALGNAGLRLMTLIGVTSLLALVAGLYRLGRATFGPFAALLACLLLLSRFHFAFYAAFAFLDVPFLALVVWAAALEAERPRRGAPVLVLLVLAGLLRPEGWLYLGGYAVWLGYRASWSKRAQLIGIVALAPVIWGLVDLIVTGNPTFSFTYTANDSAALGRQKEIYQLPGAVLTGLSDLCKPPVLLAGAAGIVLAVRRLAPRQTTVPLLLVGGGVTSFLITSVAGMAVITRYLALAALGVTLFAGWFLEMGIVVMARRASRRLLVVGAGSLLLSGAVWSGAHLHLGGATNEMTLRTHVEAELRSLLHGEPIARARRCGPVSVPNQKLMPLVLLDLHALPGSVVARSDPRSASATRTGVALVVTGGHRLLYHTAYGPFGNNTHDPHTINDAPPGFRAAAAGRYFTLFVRCT